jgi:transcriptional regulator with XRE-family HTH domain
MQPKQSAASVLRDLRTSQKRSLRMTAADLGLAASHLSRLERGERSCTAELGQRIADYYGVSPELIELAGGKVAPDIARILAEHPEEILRLRGLYGKGQVGESRE